MKTVIIALLVLIGTSHAGEQSVSVKGRLLCRGKPAQFAEVKLVDYGFWGNTDMTKNMFADPSGFFQLSGSVDEYSTMDPWVYIWHHCHEKPSENNDPCYLLSYIQVPKIHIQKGVLPDKTWDIGEFPLELSKGGKEYCT